MTDESVSGVPPSANEYELVERRALDAFEALGWDVHDINRPRPNSGDVDTRETASQVVLRDRLRRAVKRLNPWIDRNNLERAVSEIVRVAEPNTVKANQEIHRKLVSHISVKQDLGRGKRNQTVKFIDYEEPENNEFLVLNQYEVKGPQETIKPDIVAFVNGIPLGVIECKNPRKHVEPAGVALNQLMRYQNARGHEKEGAENLFRYNYICAGIWLEGNVAGAVKSPRNRYQAWRYPREDKEPEETARLRERLGFERITPQDKLIYSLFEKERLLDILRHFTVFEEKGQGTVKKVAYYQQYQAVQKTLTRIMNRAKDPADGGVVWHTQGSGKSLTMLFLGLKLRSLKDTPTLLVVTDRKTLDRQISATFEQCGFPNPRRAESIEDLKEKLSGPPGQTFTTTIQKFQERGEEDKDFPVLSERDDVFVMVDEAHRTQYKKLANNMRTALPNAFYVAFTGTPIEKERRNIRDTFGNYIDTYPIEQSVEDGNTVPIYYQGRLADIHLEGRDIDDLFDRIFRDKSEEEKREIKKRYASEKDLAEAPTRIQKIALDIVKHYEEAVSEQFKALVVTPSRRAAVRYKEKLDELNAPPSAVLISADHNDPPDLKKYALSDQEQQRIKERFKEVDDPLKIVVVCDMLLTGYDAPVAQIMYLDKPLKEHNLLQAIARVNRPFKGKEHGLIIDYYGISDDLHEALKQFSEEDVRNALTEVEDVKPRLEAARRDALSFFSDVEEKSVEEYVTALEDEEKRLKFNTAFKRFSKLMDIVMPDPAANPHKGDIKFLGEVYAHAKNRYRDQSIDLSGCGEKVRKLIENHISATDIRILNKEPVSIMDERSFEEELEHLDSDRARASEMKNALKHEISVRYDEDPAFYTSLQEKLEKLIEQYKQRRLNEQEIIEEYDDLIHTIRHRELQAHNLGLNDTTELSFYHTLKKTMTGASGEDTLNVEEGVQYDGKELTDAAKDLVSRLRNKRVVDWKRKIKVQKEMRKSVKEYLLENYRDLSFEEMDRISHELVRLARCHFQ